MTAPGMPDTNETNPFQRPDAVETTPSQSPEKKPGMPWKKPTTAVAAPPIVSVMEAQAVSTKLRKSSFVL